MGSLNFMNLSPPFWMLKPHENCPPLGRETVNSKSPPFRSRNHTNLSAGRNLLRRGQRRSESVVIWKLPKAISACLSAMHPVSIRPSETGHDGRPRFTAYGFLANSQSCFLANSPHEKAISNLFHFISEEDAGLGP